MKTFTSKAKREIKEYYIRSNEELFHSDLYTIIEIDGKQERLIYYKCRKETPAFTEYIITTIAVEE